jgi:hypothetical protein
LDLKAKTPFGVGVIDLLFFHFYAGDKPPSPGPVLLSDRPFASAFLILSRAVFFLCSVSRSVSVRLRVAFLGKKDSV